MLYNSIYESGERVTTYQAYTEGFAQFEKIMQSHEAVVAKAAEKEHMVSMIKETLIEQEPEVMTYEVRLKKIRTKTQTAKPMQ